MNGEHAYGVSCKVPLPIHCDYRSSSLSSPPSSSRYRRAGSASAYRGRIDVCYVDGTEASKGMVQQAVIRRAKDSSSVTWTMMEVRKVSSKYRTHG